MFALYKKDCRPGLSSYQFMEKCSLFGCNSGFLPWLLGKRIPVGQSEPFKWHLPIGRALDETDEYAGSVLIIDLKPNRRDTNLSLYELVDVWGCSYAEWTPILLHLSGLFVDADPSVASREAFEVADADRDEPIYEFLYLNGGVLEGKLKGPWTAPPTSPTNGALLWPDALGYFLRCIHQRTPQIFAGIPE